MMKGLIYVLLIMFVTFKSEAQNDQQLKKITLNQIKELILNSSKLLGKTPEEIKGMSRPSFINDRLNMWDLFKVIDMRDDTVKSMYALNELIRIHTGCGILDILISRKSNLSFALYYEPVTKVTKTKTDNFLIKTFSLEGKENTYGGIKKIGTNTIIEFSTTQNGHVIIKNLENEKLLYYDN